MIRHLFERSCSGFLVAWLLALTSMGMSACAGRRPPPDLFLLQPLAAVRASTATDESHALVVGLGPIRFPHYLDRPQILIAETSGRLVPQDGQRWAENLADNFSRVLAEDLAARLPADRILTHPWPRSDPPDLKLSLRVNQFHLTDDRLAILDVRWELFDREGILLARKSVYTIPAGNGGIAAGVSAMNRAVDALSNEMAGRIQSQRPVRPAAH